MTDVAPPPDRPLVAVAQLAACDAELSQLERRRSNLPELAEHRALEAARAKALELREVVESSRQVLLDQQAGLDAEIAKLDLRVRELDRRLAGTEVAAKDLQAIDHELQQVRALRSAREDAVLELLEQMEPLDAELEADDRAAAAFEAQLEEVRQRGSASLRALEAELAAARPHRDEVAALVPEALLRRYEAARAKAGVTGAARLTGGRCEGCHLELPSVEVDRIRRLPLDEVPTCENCGRLLLRPNQLD